jgi:DNA-binding NtrC family response regulator
MADTVLLIDNDDARRRTVTEVLERAGFEVHREGGGGGAAAAARLQPDVALVDAGVVDAAGAEVVPQLRAGGAAVVVLADARQLDVAVRAMRAGAESAVLRGDAAHLAAAVARAAEKARLWRQLEHLRGGDGVGDPAPLGGSSEMRALARDIARMAASDPAPVLVTGEIGTGMGRVARLIHALSPRAGGPFVALPRVEADASLRSVLFDRSPPRGGSRRPALVQLADRGTLFIPDIAALPGDAQEELMEVIDAGRVRRAGGSRRSLVDVRFVAASHRDLAEELRAGRMREDLLYRLSVQAVRLPPVRERPREDRLALVASLMARARACVPGCPAAFAPEALDLLVDAPWPGNVRELRAVLERAAVAARGAALVGVQHLPGELRARGARGERRAFQLNSLADLERQHIERALRHFGGNRTRTAQALGISRATLINKIKTFGLTA